MTNDLGKQIEEFLARGGKMEVLPSGVSSDPILLTGRDKYNRPISSRFINTKHKPPKGYQISKETNERHVLPVKLKSGKTRYKVIINGSPHGRFDTIPEAVDARNRVWAKLGIKEEDFL